MRPHRRYALALALPLLAGCAGAGALHDAGPARPLAARPSPEQLWPAVRPAAAPSPAVSGQVPPPTALPGLTVPGGDIRTVDARTALGKDPALQSDELTVLATGCQGCLVQPALYRDVTGDGRPELLTAVVTTGDSYLHVYQLRDGRLYPVLAQRVQPGFTADTVGQDLLLHEPDGPTDTTYRWSGTRLLRTDRRIAGAGTGPQDGATLCPAPTARPKAPEPLVSAVPSPAPMKASLHP
ncbi:hypothetical protein ABT095_37280 [Kitasatospora sp. NPDC002227]|uniref:hypothetical protein n=1 Tax=Kitasatospora sp. NPDC002227 TaxID=3154773 RepID=UPI0033300742